MKARKQHGKATCGADQDEWQDAAKKALPRHGRRGERGRRGRGRRRIVGEQSSGWRRERRRRRPLRMRGRVGRGGGRGNHYLRLLPRVPCIQRNPRAREFLSGNVSDPSSLSLLRPNLCGVSWLLCFRLLFSPLFRPKLLLRRFCKCTLSYL
ncbi:hypothetical protein MUK42_25648 [Musa troglodytarum]|uniref:Uncharacterized protein n=1 Tax=Musa troglodytarum TaxID=320322 RepID=A0A9E7L9X3_9LILI|nr:hypothetical protein MUK42_25648 [Musa troglodytarum]URE45755.1 hypothetical protein MUK42_25648 [Musa troglodytarum]URE45756.1 hypothetical protein MUK42_25648 [Musa troglodytarum]